VGDDIRTLRTKGDREGPPPGRISGAGSDLRVLVTGFKPFGADPYNPSGIAAKCLDGRRVDNLARGGLHAAHIHGVGDIPVHFANESDDAADAVLHAILDIRPDVVISLGQAPDPFLRIELRARDNREHHDPRIVTSSPEYQPEYRTLLDVDRVAMAIRGAGVEASTSEDAGAFVCEDLFYHVMRYVQTRPGGVDIKVAGFIHVPRFVLVDVPLQGLVEAGDPILANPQYDPSGRSPFTPNTGEGRAVPQSRINDAVFRAIEATVAGVPVDTDSPVPGPSRGLRHG
jgi:pyroglutamyl-peptidase